MPLPTDLIQVQLPNLDAATEGGYCFTGFQRFAVDILEGARWLFRTTTGNLFYNYGATTPSVDNRIYPWFYIDGRRYDWSTDFGIWVSQRSPLETTFGQLWVPEPGTPESALWSLDGGDGTNPNPFMPDCVTPNPAFVAPTPVTGAMWRVICPLRGRMPLGVGTLQPSGTVRNLNDSGGVDQVTLLANQVAKHTHIVNTVDRLDNSTLWSHFDPGGESPSPLPEKPIEPSAAGTTTSLVAQQQTDGDQPHDNMPPYYTCFFIQPTSRKYYTLPG